MDNKNPTDDHAHQCTHTFVEYCTILSLNTHSLAVLRVTLCTHFVTKPTCTMNKFKKITDLGEIYCKLT